MQAFPPIISPTVTMSTQRRMRCEQLRGTQSSDAHPGSLTATPVPEADRTTARALGTCPPPPPVWSFTHLPETRNYHSAGRGQVQEATSHTWQGPTSPLKSHPEEQGHRHTLRQVQVNRQDGDLPGNHPAGNRVPMKRQTTCSCTSLGGAHGDSSNYDLQSGVSWDFSRN